MKRRDWLKALPGAALLPFMAKRENDVVLAGVHWLDPVPFGFLPPGEHIVPWAGVEWHVKRLDDGRFWARPTKRLPE